MSYIHYEYKDVAVDVKYLLRVLLTGVNDAESAIIELKSMSGHSKWSTIKRQKAANDNARGKAFSKLVRGITIAAKAGGPDLASNYKLRIAVDNARAENMPKDTIDRAINKAKGSETLEEVTYEGFGPGGVGLLVHVATDNRNRTAQEVKSIFDRSGGSLGGPGSVSFNFEPKGYIEVKKLASPDNQILALIDLGVEELEETEEGIDVYIKAQELFNTKSKVEELGYKVLAADLVQKPKARISLEQKDKEKFFQLVASLESLEEVQNIFNNAA